MTTAAADYRKLAKRYRDLPERMVRAGAAELRKTTLTQLKHDVGSDRALSGVWLKGRGKVKYPLNVTLKVDTSARAAVGTFQVVRKQRGLWSIIEGGTVTGSPAKFTFTRGVEAGMNAAEDKMADEWQRVKLMANRRQDLETRIIAKDDASKVIDKVADELDTLEKRDTTIDLVAEDKATAEVKSLSQLLAGLSDEDKTVVLNAKVSDAERNIDRILRSLRDVDKMDQKEIDVRVEMLGDARAELDQVQDELRQLDGETATVKVEASGLDDMLGKVDSLPGKFGEMGGAISSALGPLVATGPGAAVAGAAAIGSALIGAADAAADLALDAQTMSQLTGDSVENSSRLQAVWKQSGADINDLNDVLAADERGAGPVPGTGRAARGQSSGWGDGRGTVHRGRASARRVQRDRRRKSAADVAGVRRRGCPPGRQAHIAGR